MADIELGSINHSNSETEPLLIKKSPSALLEPFSLSGLKKSLKYPIMTYERFAVGNGAIIEAIEGSLRSLCYILPGRFKDAEFVSEIMFAVLNLFRFYNDLLMGVLDRSMSLHQRNLLSFFKYLKSRHPLLKSLMAILNVVRIAQIPLEMVVARLAKKRQSLFVFALELSKLVVRLGIWQGSGWRPLSRQLYVTLERSSTEEIVPTEAGDKESDPIKKLERKMRALDMSLKEAGGDADAVLNSYLRGHKSSALTHHPQLAFSPCLAWSDWTRELAHLSRPCIYCSNGRTRGSKVLKWVPISISLVLDLYSKWPELNSGKSSSRSPSLRPSSLEAEERNLRLLDFLYYPLRGPLYETITSGLLNSVEARLSTLPLLHPLSDTLKIYQRLCEQVYFYTSAS